MAGYPLSHVGGFLPRWYIRRKSKRAPVSQLVFQLRGAEISVYNGIGFRLAAGEGKIDYSAVHEGVSSKHLFFVTPPSRRSYTVLTESSAVPYHRSRVPSAGGMAFSGLASLQRQVSSLQEAYVDLASKVGSHERMLTRLMDTLVDISNRVNMLERAVSDLLKEREKGG